MYRPIETADEHAFARVLHACFDSPVDAVSGWWDTAGRDNIRVFEVEGDVVGGLTDIPMGWFQGGSRLALHGVCGVAVAPEARGIGVARKMLNAYLHELHGRGVPLSALYGSTRGLYRSVGYGIGGRTYDTTVTTQQFRAVGHRDAGWRRATEADREAVKSLHRRLARLRGGFERGPYLWARVWAYRGSPNHVLVCEREGEVVAWVALRHEPAANDFMSIRLLDHGALDAGALRRVAGLVSTYAAMALTTQLKSGAEEPLLDLLVENRVDQRMFEPWLLRVVRVREALEQRGWTGPSGTVSFRIGDASLPENTGPWRLEVSEGRARCTRCEQEPQVALDVRGLAGLFTGGASVEALRRRGLVDGPDEELATLQALFVAPAPSINDYF